MVMRIFKLFRILWEKFQSTSTCVAWIFFFILKWKELHYSIGCWSLYEGVLANDPGTTNLLEGWHWWFSSIVGVFRTDIDLQVISSLNNKQARMEMVNFPIQGEKLTSPAKCIYCRTKRLSHSLLIYFTSWETIITVYWNVIIIYSVLLKAWKIGLFV